GMASAERRSSSSRRPASSRARPEASVPGWSAETAFSSAVRGPLPSTAARRASSAGSRGWPWSQKPGPAALDTVAAAARTETPTSEREPLKPTLIRSARRQLHGPQGAGVAAGQDAHELVVEIVGRVADTARHALGVHLAATLDVFLEPLVEVLLAASLADLGLVVELDLAHHQPREPLGFLVGLLLLGGQAGGGRAGQGGR